MADTAYTYSISADFPNGKVDSARLQQEIRASAIVTALAGISTGGDICSILFKAALSAEDETILDGIVATHSGEPLVDTTPMPVKIVENNLLNPDTALSETDGHDVVIKAGQSLTEQDITYPYELDVLAARYWVATDNDNVKAGDRFDIVGIPGGDPFVGYVTDNVAQGETVIPASETAFDYLRHGMMLKFESHAKIYRILDDDPVAGTLTLSEGLEQAITVGDLIYVRRALCANMNVKKGVVVTIGDLNPGSAGLCANAKLHIMYYPESQPSADFTLCFELIYSY